MDSRCQKLLPKFVTTDRNCHEKFFSLFLIIYISFLFILLRGDDNNGYKNRDDLIYKYKKHGGGIG